MNNYFFIVPDKCRTCPLQSALIELPMVPFGREITFFTFETDFDFLPLISVSQTFDAFIESEPFAKFKLKKRKLDLQAVINSHFQTLKPTTTLKCPMIEILFLILL